MWINSKAGLKWLRVFLLWGTVTFALRLALRLDDFARCLHEAAGRGPAPRVLRHRHCWRRVAG